MDTEVLISTIESMQSEENTPKQISNAFNKIIEILKSDEDVNTKKNKCIHELEEIEANGNLESGVRVLLLDLASALEQLEE